MYIKSIKSIYLLLFFSFVILQSCEEASEIAEKELSQTVKKANQIQAIAKIQDGKTVFYDEEKLIERLETELLAIKKLPLKISDISIDYSQAIDDESFEVIQLIAMARQDFTKLSVVLEKRDTEFFIKSEGTTLVCEGCRSGCSPRRKANGDGYCTPCDYQAKKCVKTETLPSITD